MANQNLTTRFGVGVSSNYTPGSVTGLVPSTGLPANTTASSAPAAGNVGYWQTTSRVRSAATALTSATTANVTASALTLTAGTYDLYGTIGFLPGATTTSTTFDGGISTTSATLSGTDTLGVQDASGQIRAKSSQASAAIVTDLVILTVKSRVTITTSTTFYLVTQATFAISTMSAYGALSATQV